MPSVITLFNIVLKVLEIAIGQEKVINPNWKGIPIENNLEILGKLSANILFFQPIQLISTFNLLIVGFFCLFCFKKNVSAKQNWSSICVRGGNS